MPPLPGSAGVRRFLNGALFLALVLGVASSRPAGAQDDDLLALLTVAAGDGELDQAEARTLQLYRIPIFFTLREPGEERLGLRLTLPVSLGANEIAAASDVGDFFERFESLTVTPGVELPIDLAPQWRLEPFAEVGVTVSSSSAGSQLTYGVGARTRFERALGPARLLLGGAARYASPREHRAELQDYTALELGADLQTGLGFTAYGRPTAGGVYAVVRVFPDLEGPESALLHIGRLYEAGISFSTDPAPRLWFVELPWIALGYRWGGPLSGLRLSLAFPF